ncbi:hypothetical protein ABIE49_000636 [Bradyrhizobium sp. OAE829]
MNSRRLMPSPVSPKALRIGSNECFDTKPPSLLQHEMLADVRFGSISEVDVRFNEVGSVPVSGHCHIGHAGPKSAQEQTCTH